MRRSIRNRWLADLRSGRFVQGQQKLLGESEEGETCYCCLGVLLQGLGARLSGGGYWLTFEGEDFASPDEELDRDTLAALGLSPEAQSELIYLNDGTKGARPHSFLEIADWVETHVPTEPR